MIKGIPVRIVAKNGIPVIPVESDAPLMTVVENGFGIPIVIVEKFGVPFVVQGYNPIPPVPPMEFFFTAPGNHLYPDDIQNLAPGFSLGEDFTLTIGTNPPILMEWDAVNGYWEVAGGDFYAASGTGVVTQGAGNITVEFAGATPAPPPEVWQSFTLTAGLITSDGPQPDWQSFNLGAEEL